MGEVPKYVQIKSERKFLTGQAEYSQYCERLGSCLVVECLVMKSSTSFERVPLPPLHPSHMNPTPFM